MSAKKFWKKNWKTILNVFTFGILIITVYFLRDDIGRTIKDLGRVNAIFLLLIPFWQVVNYSAYANLYRSFLKILNVDVDSREMFKTSVEMNFVNHVLPSGGVSGFSYFALRLKEYDVTGTKSTFTQTMRFVLTFGTYIILLFVGLFLLALGGSASNLTILITCSIAFITLFGLLVGVYVISSKTRIRQFSRGLSKFVNMLVGIFRLKSKDTINLKRAEQVFSDLHTQYLLLKSNWRELKTPTVYAMIANISELATIYTVYLAYGKAVNPGAVIIAYAVANFAGLIAVLPGGIGVYEGLMTAVLVSAGIPAGLAISVTVMYRILTMAVALPPGYYLYHKALNKLEAKRLQDDVKRNMQKRESSTLEEETSNKSKRDA